MGRGMMLGKVVSTVKLPGSPVEIELTLGNAIF
jgi:hypothetical protein